MLLRKISLKNFTSYANVEVEFPGDESIAIVGPNGAGKSSLLDAVYYALYGESLRGGIRDIIRAGQKDMETELIFETPSGVYKVRRTVSVKGPRHESKAYLYKETDGGFRLIARGAKEVTREVGRIIGVDKTLFTAAYYVRQGEIASLLSMEPAKRKEMVSRLLGLNYFENAYQRLYDVIRGFEAEVVSMLKNDIERKKRLLEERDRYRGEIRALEEKISENEARLRGLVKTEDELSRKLEEAEARLEEVEEAVNRFKVLEEKIRLYSERASRLENEIKDAEMSKAKLEEIRLELKRIEPYYKAREAALIIKNAQDSLNFILGRIKELEGSLAQIPLLKKEAEEYEALQGEAEELEKKWRELEKNRVSHKEAGSKLSDVEKRIRILRERVDSYIRPAGVRLSEFRGEQFFNIPSKIDELRRKTEDELRTVEKTIEELQDTLSRLREREKQLLKWIKGLSEIKESRCPLCGSPLTEEHKRELLKRYSREHEEVRKRIVEVGRRLEEAQRRRDAIRKKHEGLTRVDPQHLKSMLEELVNLEAEKGRLQANIKELEEKIAGLQRDTSRLSEVKNRLAELESVYHHYKYLLEERERLEKDLEEYKSKLEELNLRLDEARKSLVELGLEAEDPETILENARKYEQLDKEAEKLRLHAARIKKLREELKTLKEDLLRAKKEKESLAPIVKEKENLEDQVKALRKTLTSVKERKGQILGSLRELKSTRANYVEELSRLEEELKRLEGVEERYRVAEEVLHTLEKIREVFSKDGAPSKIRARIVPRVERLTREFLQVFDLNIQDITLGDDFSVEVREGSQLRGISTLSGGEQAIVALSLRLAIARSTAEGTGLLMFDEPTANLDEERRRRLVEALKMLPEMGGGPRQMIIVTHDRDLEDAVGLVYEVKRTPNGSVVKLAG